MVISSITTSKDILKYAKIGSGKKNMIMLPGLSLTSILNSANAVEDAYKLFNEKYSIYLIEYPNINNLEDIADTIYEGILRLKLDNCYLIGASFGGMIGQILLGKYPNLFNKALLVSTISYMTNSSINAASNWYKLALNNDIRSLNKAFYNDIYSNDFKDKYKEVINNSLDIGSIDDCIIMSKRLGMILNLDLRKYDKLIKTPTLVVGAKLDNVFSYSDILELANLIGCNSFFYEESSHALFDEEVDFKERLYNFFEK